MSSGGDLFAPVLDALTADPSTEFGTPGAQIEVLRTVDGRYSSVRRVSIRTPTRTTHAYIKVLKPRGPGQDELARIDRMLQREFTATAAVYNALQQDAGLGAARPLALLPQYRAMATEEVPGRPWGDVLVDASGATDELAAVAGRVGAWVRAYQKIGDGPGQVDLAERRAYLDERLMLLEGRVISQDERQAVLRRFDALARDIGSGAVRHVPIHADLTPMNIIVDAHGRVTVLDFTMAKSGTEHHDLSHVYFHLEMMGARHRARRPMFHALQQAMLAGYDPTLSAADPLFRMMLMQHGVCHVALLAERKVPVLDVAYRWFLRRRWDLCSAMPAPRAALRVA
jgi:hypothetical protein